jgi:hypothetical protein
MIVDHFSVSMWTVSAWITSEVEGNCRVVNVDRFSVDNLYNSQAVVDFWLSQIVLDFGSQLFHSWHPWNGSAIF